MSQVSVSYQTVDTPEGVRWYYTGPSIEEGAMPAVFYFALAGDESLCLDPFNQPIAHLQGKPLRCWSLTLPGHGPGFDKTQAISYFASEMREGRDIIGPFLAVAQEAIEWLVSAGYVDSSRMAVAGLSRGGFIATHLAARVENLDTVLGFAPLTCIEYHPEFQDIKELPAVQALSMTHLIPRLTRKRLRYYIGNRDQRVSTDCCFSFIRQLTDYAFDEGVRTPQVEMIIGSSIGFQGHGTAPHVFYAGADWLDEQLTQ